MRKLIFILIFNNILSIGWNQSIKEVLEIANKQYHLANYNFALKEYQRFLFFEPASNAVIYSNIGDCYWSLGQYNQAIEFYDKAFFTFESDSLRYKALFRKVDCYIRTGGFGLALSELLSLNDSLKGRDYYLKEFYCGLSYYGMQDFTNSERCFIHSIDPIFIKQREEIAQIFNDKKKFNRPNAQTAMIMSMCFPGLGQLYAGDIKNSANSLTLTSLLAYAAIHIAINESVFDAIFTIMPWFQRYYQGGYIRAETIAIQKRAEKRAKIFQHISETIASTKN